MDEVTLKLGRRTAQQVLDALQREIRVGRFQGGRSPEDMEALIRVAEDIDRQLNTRWVELKVLSVDPLPPDYGV